MKKNIICKNAIVRFNGSSEKIMRADIAKKQYSQGSVVLSKDDLTIIDCDIEADFDELGIERVVDKFPKVDKPLFESTTELQHENTQLDNCKKITLRKLL